MRIHELTTKLFSGALALILLAACASEPLAPAASISDSTAPAPKLFDGAHAFDTYLMAQMHFGPRPAGSAADRRTGDYILAQLKQSGWSTDTQEFTFRGVPIRNVIGKVARGRGSLIILGAHYDTRPRATEDKTHPELPVPGANDGASGVAVLLELARTLDVSKLRNEVWLAFFDAEDNGDLDACTLAEAAHAGTPAAFCDKTVWPWSVGARYTAEHLSQKPSAVVILDMIGDADQNIYYEHNSDKQVQEQLWSIAKQLGYEQQFIPDYKWSMDDDHTPFLQKDIRAVDVIDFDYPYWHTVNDTAEHVSAASLERVGRVMQTWLETEGE